MADDVKAPSREDLAGFIRSVTYGLCDATSPTGTAAWERNKRVVDWLRTLPRADNPPGEGVVMPMLDAIQAVVRAAWSLVDNTEEHPEHPRIEPDDYRAVGDALDQLEALIPESEQPASAGHAVTLLRTALTAARPAAPGDGEVERLRVALADIESLAETISEARSIAAAALAPSAARDEQTGGGR
jgi:hypothetical protein